MIVVVVIGLSRKFSQLIQLIRTTLLKLGLVIFLQRLNGFLMLIKCRSSIEMLLLSQLLPTNHHVIFLRFLLVHREYRFVLISVEAHATILIELG